MTWTPFNGLTPAEAERLAILAEECGEVIQIVSKVLRHGYENHNPLAPEQGTNRQILEREMGDVQCVIRWMQREGDVSIAFVQGRAATKLIAMQPYLHEQATTPERQDGAS